MGLAKVRAFIEGEIARPDQSLYEIWRSTVDELSHKKRELKSSTGNNKPNSATTSDQLERMENLEPNLTQLDDPDWDLDVGGWNEEREEGEGDFQIEEREETNSGEGVFQIEDVFDLSEDRLILDDEMIGQLHGDGLNRSVEEEVLECEQTEEKDESGLENSALEVVMDLEEILGVDGDENTSIQVVAIECPKSQILKTPTKTTVDNLPGPSAQEQTPIGNNLPNVPSPFKRNLFWPEHTTTSKKRKLKERIPSVITSEQGKEYLKRKEEVKKKKEVDKEIKRLQREAKKIIKKENEGTKKRTQVTNQIINSDSSDDDLDSSCAQKAITEEDIENLTINNWVVIPYVIEGESKNFVGQIKKLDRDNKKVTVKFLTKKGNKYAWPEENDVDEDIPISEIVQILSPPTVERRGYFSFTEKIL